MIGPDGLGCAVKRFIGIGIRNPKEGAYFGKPRGKILKKKKKNQDIMVCILWQFSRQSTTSLEPSGLWNPVLNFGERRESLLWKSLLEKSRGLLKLANLRVHRLNHLD